MFNLVFYRREGTKQKILLIDSTYYLETEIKALMCEVCLHSYTP